MVMLKHWPLLHIFQVELYVLTCVKSSMAWIVKLDFYFCFDLKTSLAEVLQKKEYQMDCL